MLLWLVQSLALTLMVCVIVTNWLVVKSAQLFQGAIRQLYRWRHGTPSSKHHKRIGIVAQIPVTMGARNPTEEKNWLVVVVCRQVGPTAGRLVTAAVFCIALTVAEVYVLLRPSSSRFCSQPLLENLICNIGFTLFMAAFALILLLQDPVPSWLRLLFNTFGAASLIEGVFTVLTTSLAGECAITTPALYCLSVVFSALNVLTTGFFLLVGPFWLLHSRFPGTVLNRQSRTGICYEPVTCCPCVWHV